MNKIWTYIDKKNWKLRTKYAFFMAAFCLPFALLGFFVWLLIRPLAFSSLDWMFCFIGYPIVICYIAAFLYGCNHEFHDGESI